MSASFFLQRVRNTMFHARGLTRHVAAGVLGAVLAIAFCSGTESKYPDPRSYCNGRAQAECSQEVILACGLPNASTCTTKRQEACLASAPAGTYNSNGAETCI